MWYVTPMWWPIHQISCDKARGKNQACHGIIHRTSSQTGCLHDKSHTTVRSQFQDGAWSWLPRIALELLTILLMVPWQTQL